MFEKTENKRKRGRGWPILSGAFTWSSSPFLDAVDPPIPYPDKTEVGRELRTPGSLGYWSHGLKMPRPER